MSSGGSKIPVTIYMMAQHFGICAGPIDALKRIVIKEKDAWLGNVTAQSNFIIDQPELFGGVEKEGGIEGVVYYLPGLEDQIVDDVLAVKLGRSSGADCPGYRGIASIFMVGPAGTPYAADDATWNDHVTGEGGMYWSANIPYLPGVWAEVERAAIGLDPAFAFCGGVAGPSAAIFIAMDVSTQVNHGTRMQTIIDGTVGYLEYVRGLVAAGQILDLSVTWFWETTVSYKKRGISDVADIDDAIAFAEAASAGVSDICDWRQFANAAKTFFDATDDSIVDRQLVVAAWGTAGWPFMAADAAATLASTAEPFVCRVVMVENTIQSDALLIDSDADVPTIADGDGAGMATAMIGAITPTEAARRDANPAHMIYECLTNTDWGMGSPSTAINVTSFEDAAVTLHGENFCLSMIWTRQSSIQSFIQEVLDHIQAALFVDPADGLLTLKLIRGDYVADDLDEINPSNANLSNFSRKLWGEIPNEMVVTWTNPETEEDETVGFQDLASIATQGGIVSDSRNYYGVRNGLLAGRLAQRDLRGAGQPLAACDAEIDRTLWRVRPASVYKLTWPEYGASGIIMRVIDVDYGKPGDPTIRLALIEDVFGLDIGQYVEPAVSGWTDPSSPPQAISAALTEIITIPAFVAAREAASTPVYPTVLAGVLASSTNADAFGYALWGQLPLADGTLVWTSLAELAILGHAETGIALVAESSSTITFSSFIGNHLPMQAGFVIIGAAGEDGNEIAMFTTVGTSYVIQRGVLDTVPRAWASATPVYFVDDSLAFVDPTTRSSGEAVAYKLLMRTSLGLYPLASASLVNYTLTDRPWQPNRPANVIVYGAAFSSFAAPVDATARPDPWVTVTWANRNRLLEDSQVLSWTDASIAPETGQTTTITVLMTDGATVLATHDLLTGTTFDVPDASFGAEAAVIIRTSSSRDDADGVFESLQGFDHYVYVGASFIVSETGDARVAEDGSRRIMEG